MYSGIFIRIQRDGKWLSLDILDCTPEELEPFFGRKDKDDLVRWLVTIIKLWRKDLL